MEQIALVGDLGVAGDHECGDPLVKNDHRVVRALDHAAVRVDPVLDFPLQPREARIEPLASPRMRGNQGGEHDAVAVGRRGHVRIETALPNLWIPVIVVVQQHIHPLDRLQQLSALVSGQCLVGQCGIRETRGDTGLASVRMRSHALFNRRRHRRQ